MESTTPSSMGPAASMMWIPILADVLPDPVTEEEGGLPIAIIVVLVIAALIIAAGLWALLSRSRRDRR